VNRTELRTGPSGPVFFSAAAGSFSRKGCARFATQSPTFNSNKSAIPAYTVSPDGDTLIGAGWFKLLVWDLRDGRLTQYPTEHLGKISAVAVSPDGAHWLSPGRETDFRFLMTSVVSHQVERRFRSLPLCGGRRVSTPTAAMPRVRPAMGRCIVVKTHRTMSDNDLTTAMRGVCCTGRYTIVPGLCDRTRMSI